MFTSAFVSTTSLSEVQVLIIIIIIICVCARAFVHACVLVSSCAHTHVWSVADFDFWCVFLGVIHPTFCICLYSVSHWPGVSGFLPSPLPQCWDYKLELLCPKFLAPPDTHTLWS